MPANRRYRVRFRVKMRRLLFRRAGLVLGFALAAGLAVYGGVKLSGAVSRMAPLSRFLFRLEKLELDCPSPEVKEEARSLFLARRGRTLSSLECSALALEIKKRHPAVRDVSVSRNFLNGAASVKVRIGSVVAPVLLEGGTTAYLSAEGELFAENLSAPYWSGARIEIYGGGSRSFPALAGFIKDVGSMEKDFFSGPARMEYRPHEKSCRIILANGCEVLWGEFEFTRLKILRLNEVLKDVSSRLRFPVRIDLRFFREGRVFVSRPHAVTASSQKSAYRLLNSESWSS